MNESANNRKAEGASMEFFEQRQQVYAMSSLKKVKHIRDLRIDHLYLRDVGDRLVEFLHPFNDVSIISIAGVSGVGKTTLVEELTPQLLESVDYEQPGGIFFIKAPATSGRKMEISAVWDLALARLDGMEDKKFGIEEDDDRIRMQMQRQSQKVEWRKGEMLRLLSARRVLALAIDEAFHLLRFGEPHALLDTLKSIASDLCPKLIVIGGLEMLEAMEGYSQVDLRSSTVYLPRYGATSGLPESKGAQRAHHAREKAELCIILKRLEEFWPYEEAPGLVAMVDYFYDVCLGNMRMIKRQCERYAQVQARNDGKWDDGFFEDCEVPINRIARVKEEFEALEEQIRGSDDGGLALNPTLRSDKKSAKARVARRKSVSK